MWKLVWITLSVSPSAFDAAGPLPDVTKPGGMTRQQCVDLSLSADIQHIAKLLRLEPLCVPQRESSP